MNGAVEVARERDLLGADGRDATLSRPHTVWVGAAAPHEPVATKRAATAAFSLTNVSADALSVRRLGPKSSLHGLSRPAIWSLMSMQASVPFVMPHF